MSYLLLFFAGIAACNAIPHLAAGMRGEPFPSPFAKPRGRGPSSPLVNALWGSFNLALALVLTRAALHLAFDWAPWAAMAGFTVMAAVMSWRFGEVRRSGSF